MPKRDESVHYQTRTGTLDDEVVGEQDLGRLQSLRLMRSVRYRVNPLRGCQTEPRDVAAMTSETVHVTHQRVLYGGSVRRLGLAAGMPLGHLEAAFRHKQREKAALTQPIKRRTR